MTLATVLIDFLYIYLNEQK